MKAIADFQFNGVRFNIVHLDTQDKVQVWYQNEPGKPFEFGHSKPVPQGMPVNQAALIMGSFLKQDITHFEYNDLLPS